LGQADEGTTCGEAAVAGEDVQVGVPLQEISCGGEEPLLLMACGTDLRRPP
jgi:hypothetical protein